MVKQDTSWFKRKDVIVPALVGIIVAILLVVWPMNWIVMIVYCLALSVCSIWLIFILIPSKKIRYFILIICIIFLIFIGINRTLDQRTKDHPQNMPIPSEQPEAKQSEQQKLEADKTKIKSQIKIKIIKNKKIIKALSQFHLQGTIIQEQCRGVYLDQLKGKIPHDRWVEWSEDIDNYFRKESIYDTHHPWVENNDYGSWKPKAGMSDRDARTWDFVRQKKDRLQEMIDDFKKQLLFQESEYNKY
ncbi:MAG: hypothetical protein A4E64_00935 [Syntrophorhabdus sp. PtaU1.Bin058]|nr:MAG: hypothetical protein A4E64_00935 [Syntrophorhabdus sp. PtaU1.Bin058]